MNLKEEGPTTLGGKKYQEWKPWPTKGRGSVNLVGHVCQWNGVSALSLLTVCVHGMESLLQACWMNASVKGVTVLSPLPVCVPGIGLLFGDCPDTEGLEAEKSGNSKGCREPFSSQPLKGLE